LEEISPSDTHSSWFLGRFDYPGVEWLHTATHPARLARRPRRAAAEDEPAPTAADLLPALDAEADRLD